MSFAEEFLNLDPVLLERAYANVSEDLLLIASSDEKLASKVIELHERIKETSFGYMVLIGRHEETIQMVSETPGMEYGQERHRMIQMNLGILGVGLVLTEYARLESEED